MKHVSTMAPAWLVLFLSVGWLILDAAADASCGKCPTETKGSPAGAAATHETPPVADGHAQPAGKRTGNAAPADPHQAAGQPPAPADAQGADDGHGHDAGSDLDLTRMALS